MVMAFSARPSGARAVPSRQDLNSRIAYSAMNKLKMRAHYHWSVNTIEPDKYQACFSPPTSTLSTQGKAASTETRLRAGRAGVESRYG
jgi:hypothetical protein